MHSGERYEDEPELLEGGMRAFRGECRLCHQIVVMGRGVKGELRPDHCWCIACGKPYYLKMDDIDAWEEQQWREKELK